MLKLYNSLHHKKETFIPMKPGLVYMYNCGPTVYDYAHIGNLSSYLMADFLRRYFEYKGVKVRQVMNITDVGHLSDDADSGEDKMLKGAKREKKTPDEIARFYEDAFVRDLWTLNMRKPYRLPRATMHVKEMILLIKTLLKKGHAYAVKGNVYFDVATFKEYGALSGNTVSALQNAVRQEVIDDKNKRHAHDFALWIKAPAKHIMKWDSPWSMGYPGWHIECSAMSKKYLGPHFDIHTGGEDNKFPHHENEIAQSTCANDKPLANVWLHRKLLMVEGQKMSKSKNNFYTLAKVETKLGFDPLVFRVLVFSSHYRKQLDFSKKSLHQAKQNMTKVLSFVERIQEIIDHPLDIKSDIADTAALIKKTKIAFDRAMDDDLNTPAAIKVILQFVRQANNLVSESRVGREEAKALLDFVYKLDEVVGVFEEEHTRQKKAAEVDNEQIETLATERDEAREHKDFAEADRIRNQLLALGVTVKDDKNGTTWKRL